MLPQMSGFIKYFNGIKHMSFIIKYDKVLVKYNETRGKIKGLAYMVRLIQPFWMTKSQKKAYITLVK